MSRNANTCLSPAFLREKFEAGQNYEDYLASGSAQHRAGWDRLRGLIELSAGERGLLGSFERRLNVVISSGVWCGDCAQQMPVIDHIERAAGGKVVCRFLDRDEHADLAERVMLCGGLRVPVVLILNEDFDLLVLAGDRSLSRYRAMAARQLGPSCPVPGADLPADEIRAMTADWVASFEHAHLMARMSTKLRMRYRD